MTSKLFIVLTLCAIWGHQCEEGLPDNPHLGFGDEDVPVIEGDGGEIKIVTEADVLVLTEENFDLMVMSKPLILVEFYAPWCGHCKTLEPEYAKAASILKDNIPPVPLAKMDATAHPNVAKRFEVTGFPTIMLFRKGDKTEYDGSRTASGIVEYLREQADPDYKPPESSLVKITASTYQDFVTSHDISLVEFYAPWCGHCKNLAPELERAGRVLKGDGIPIAQIDGNEEENKALAKELNVNGFPTLFIYRRGKKFIYDGPREEKGIIRFMREMKTGPSVSVDSVSELAKKIHDSRPTVLGVFDHENTRYKTFNEAANSLRSKPFLFLHSFNPEGVKEKANTIVVITAKFFQTKYEENKIKFQMTTDTTPEDIVNFIESNSVPLVGQRTYNNAFLYLNKYPLIVVYYDVDFSFDGRVETQLIRNKVAKIASKYKGITFCISKESDYEDELKDLKLDDAGESVNVGFFASKKERFALAPEDEFDPILLDDFVEEVLAGKVRPITKSQPIPVKNPGPVKVVVGDTIKTLTTNSKMNILLEFYAPWCGHCNKFEPIYTKLAQKYASIREDLVVAKIDGTQNDYGAHFEVTGFPTIYFIPAHSTDRAIKYSGDRSIESLSSFLDDHLPPLKDEL